MSAREYDVSVISDDKLYNREPVISETGMVAWSAYYSRDTGEARSDIFIYTNGNRRSITDGLSTRGNSNIRPQTQSNTVVWVATFPDIENIEPNWVLREVPDRDEGAVELIGDYRLRMGPAGEQIFETREPASPLTNQTPADPSVPDTLGTNTPSPANTNVNENARRTPSGDNEICRWEEIKNINRITRDGRNDLGPSFWGNLIAWQKAKGWPFGWEIMTWYDGTLTQLTTNFYYDMAPKVHKDQVTWYGWDGHDFEIFLYDRTNGIMQITSNQYDDVSPAIWDGVIVWEAYAGIDADIYMWKEGKIKKISENIEDDLNPRIWNGQVVWQGFDGDDYEIYLFDDVKTIKLTSNTYDDVNPDIRDDVICWMGYHDNWDAEIFVWDGGPQAVRLTDNTVEDRDPRTCSGQIVWQQDRDNTSLIYLAAPRP